MQKKPQTYIKTNSRLGVVATFSHMSLEVLVTAIKQEKSVGHPNRKEEHELSLHEDSMIV